MEKLLEKLLSNSKEFLKNSSSQDNYNIFSVLNITNREIYHSRFLADLLNPKGFHKKGTVFLEAFLNELNQISDEKFKNNDLENTNVITEEVTNYGNLDISLKNKDFYIIIENKVWAGDQDAQLYRYSNTLFNGKEPKLVYLTPKGTPPSKNSLGNLNEEKILKISYKETIINWINNCLVNKDILNNENILNVLNQYIETIEFEKDNIMEIKIENEEIQNYLLLQKSLNLAISNKRIEIFNIFFETISTKLEQCAIKVVSKVECKKNDMVCVFFTVNEIFYGLGLDGTGVYLGYYKNDNYDTEELKKIMEDENNVFGKNNKYIHIDNELTFTNEYFIELMNQENLNKKVENILEVIKNKLKIDK